MILERRTQQGTLRLPNNKACGDSQEKPSSRKSDKEEESPAAAASNNNERKTCNEETGETNHEPSHTEIAKTEAANASNPSTTEKTSPQPGYRLGKPAYNPITHVSSMTTYFFARMFPCCNVSDQKCFSHSLLCSKIYLFASVIVF